MKIELSNIKEYLEYLPLQMMGKYDEAEEKLKTCIEIAKKSNDNLAHVFLMQSMGNLNFYRGNVEEAIRNYEEAEFLDGGHYQSKFAFAKFLASHANEYNKSIDKCKEIIEIATKSPWPKTEADSSSEHYLAKCHALTGYCHAILGNNETAQDNLDELLKLKNERVVEYAVEFCRLMIEKNMKSDSAKEYLRSLIDYFESTREKDKYKELCKEIEMLLREIKDDSSA